MRRINTQTKQRTLSQKQRILNSLRESGDKGVTNVDLSNIALKYGSRIQELYVLGYEIETKLSDNGITTYRLVSEPEIENKNNQAAIDILIKQVEEIYKNKINSNDLVNLLDELGFTVKRKVNTHKKSNKKIV